jgi:hypothetical protein
MKNFIVQILVLGSLFTGAAFAKDAGCQKNATAEKKVLASDVVKAESKEATTAKTGK